MLLQLSLLVQAVANYSVSVPTLVDIGEIQMALSEGMGVYLHISEMKCSLIALEFGQTELQTSWPVKH